MSVSYQQMALAVLKWGGKPLSTNNVRSMVIWACSENDSNKTGTKATWNPWDTTEPWPGAKDFNGSGVRDYKTITDGLDAFWKTLTNGLYRPIIGALDNSDAPAVTCQLIMDSEWGSKPNSTLQGMILSRWDYYANLIVSGSDETTIAKPIQIGGDNEFYFRDKTSNWQYLVTVERLTSQKVIDELDDQGIVNYEESLDMNIVELLVARTS